MGSPAHQPLRRKPAFRINMAVPAVETNQGRVHIRKRIDYRKCEALDLCAVISVTPLLFRSSRGVSDVSPPVTLAQGTARKPGTT